MGFSSTSMAEKGPWGLSSPGPVFLFSHHPQAERWSEFTGPGGELGEQAQGFSPCLDGSLSSKDTTIAPPQESDMPGFQV